MSSVVIFQPPALTAEERDVLSLIAEQRDRLKMFVNVQPRRWLGSLRRSTLAKAIQGSNSIEGYHASVDDAIGIINDEAPQDQRTETWYALKGYRDALTYIMQTSHDAHFEFGKQFLKSLHFMMIGHEITKNPGQWRPGSIFVVNQSTGEQVYEAPPPEDVNLLIEDLVAYLRQDQKEETPVCAAMAHLNLTMIHPFSDGNGRMARALQTLVLARDGALHPVFSSIEEWLGRNTQEYYSVLAEVGQGSWKPKNNAMPWIRFCLRAHYQQAATLIRRNEEYELLYKLIASLIEREGLPERVELPLFDVALGQRLTNARYRNENEVTEFVASRDLRRLSECGILDPTGEKRGRYYTASKMLRAMRAQARIMRPLENPFDRVRAKGKNQVRAAKPRLPGF